MYSSDITTKYEYRAQNIPKIVDVVSEVINNVSDNIVVFFPSYNLLSSVHNLVAKKTTKKILVQRQNMGVIDAKRLIDRFKKLKNGFGGVLFAVVGGSFSEGVDLPGDELKGIIVVGLPFPEPNFEIKALIEYYDKLYNKGWDYGYQNPTIAKIVQAAGRLIRTETDKGFILLLDNRYAWKKYNSLFPDDFKFKPYDLKKIIDFIK